MKISVLLCPLIAEICSDYSLAYFDYYDAAVLYSNISPLYIPRV